MAGELGVVKLSLSNTEPDGAADARRYLLCGGCYHACARQRSRRINPNQKAIGIITVSPFSTTSDVFQLRPHTDAEAASLQAVWAASQDRDDPAMRPLEEWWPILEWATASRTLFTGNRVIGLAAIHYDPVTTTAEARLALLPGDRQVSLSRQMIHAAMALAQESGAELLRLFLPSMAEWAIDSARLWGFQPIRETHVMLRPGHLVPPVFEPVDGVSIHALLHGEEADLLEALNRAWASTWNSRPITMKDLTRDLRRQREGMLVAVEANQGRIVATCHALFDPDARNPDGHPYAWISNLTTDPDWRGRRLGRAMLAAGLEHLQGRGARSVMLGVDGGDHVPLNLYRSARFETISTATLWERSI